MAIKMVDFVFTDSEFMSAKEKLLVFRQWRKFLKDLLACDLSVTEGSDYGYFPASLKYAFTPRLYNYLSQHEGGFIAHYNRYGFLSNRFGSHECIRETIQQMTTYPVTRDYQDIHQAMLDELKGIRNRLLSK